VLVSLKFIMKGFDSELVDKFYSKTVIRQLYRGLHPFISTSG